jgi:hypothetical protein
MACNIEEIIGIWNESFDIALTVGIGEHAMRNFAVINGGYA